MTVYNGIEAGNVRGILESEGIDTLIEPSGKFNLTNMIGAGGTDIYVPEHFREKAMYILEIELARGDV